MAEPGRPRLADLAACLRGAPPHPLDWTALVGLANEHLVAPRLFAELHGRGQLDRLDPDLAGYLQQIHDLNRLRNLRLRDQAIEAIDALNDGGIEPCALKGAGFLLTMPDGKLGQRMLTDIDLMVPHERLPEATERLRGLGYHTLSHDPRIVGAHVHATFHRRQDAGSLDLHHRPPGPADIHARDGGELIKALAAKGHRARLPSPTDRVCHLIAHDMLDDRRLYKGALDFRHLLDIDELIASGADIDWEVIRQRFRGSWLRRSALDVYMAGLRALFRHQIPGTHGLGFATAVFRHRQLLKLRNRRLEWLDDLAVRNLQRPIGSIRRLYRSLT